MLSYAVYKIMHFSGIFLILFAYGALLFHSMSRGKEVAPKRALILSGHGLGMVLVLVGGFGMLARLGITDGIPSWIWIKLIVWAILGFMIALVKRCPQWAAALFGIVYLLTLVATYAAVYKV